jgi:hypothetical protein
MSKNVILDCVYRNETVPVGTSGIIVGATVDPVPHLQLKVDDKIVQVKLDDASRYWRARRA